MVALSLPHSKQWEACWRYVMGVVDLAVVPTGCGSSPAEDPGSSLDVAGRADTRASYHVFHHPATADQALPASTVGGRDGGAPPGGTDGGADRQALWLSPHHGGAAPQAGRRDAAHQPSRPCLPRAGAAGLQLGMVKHTTRLLGVSKDMGELRPDAAYDSA